MPQERLLATAESAAVRLVRRAGALIRRGQREYASKGAAGLVTATDRRAEDLLRRELPACSFWGEESGRWGEDEWCWVVDPLDGTTNFVHGFPQVAVSVALARSQKVVLGVVYDVFRRELFRARAGQGAFLNEQPIAVSAAESLGEALLATGFGGTSQDEEYARFRRLDAACHGVRRNGCCSLDLCWVACGRLEGYWEWDLQPWDVAAGGLIVQEAGGLFTRLDGAPAGLERGDFLASNGRVHEALIRA